MAVIHQKFTGDASQLKKEYDDLAAANARLEQKVNKLAQTMGGATRNGAHGQSLLNNAVKQGTQDVIGYATQWASVAGVLAGIKLDLDAIEQRQSRAAKTNVSVGSSQADIIRNLPGVGSGDKKQFLQDTQAAFSRSDFPDLNEFNRAVASGLSASAGDMKGTLRAAEDAGKLTRDKPQELDLLVGAALDIKKASGIDDAKKNLGFMLQVGGESRMTDIQQNARNIPSAIIASVNAMKGDRQQRAVDAGAVFAALGTQASDARGEQTSTSVTALAVQARDFFEKGVEKTVNGRKFRQKPKDDPGTFEGRISFLQDNEKERKRFLETSSFERKFQIPVEQLLTKGSETDKQFRSSRSKINFDDAEYRQQEKDLRDLTNSTGAATIDAKIKSNQQLAELRKEHDGRINQAKEALAKTLENTREHSMAPFGLKTVSDEAVRHLKPINDALAGNNPIRSAITEAEVRKKEIFQPGSMLFPGGKDMTAAARPLESLNLSELQDVQDVNATISLLKELLVKDEAAMRDQNKLMTEIRDELRNGSKPPDAARSPAAAVGAARNDRGGHREQ